MKRSMMVLLLLSLSIFLFGCADPKQLEAAQLQVSTLEASLLEQDGQIEALEKEKLTLEALRDRQIDDLNAMDDHLKVLQQKYDGVEALLLAAQEELEVFRDKSSLEIETLKKQNDAILALQMETGLQAIMSAYVPAMKGNVSDHYNTVLYQAVVSEGAQAFISLLEKRSFEEIDGITLHFATGLKAASNLAFKTQLMMDAQKMSAGQTPTTLYFYARVLYFLSR